MGSLAYFTLFDLRALQNILIHKQTKNGPVVGNCDVTSSILKELFIIYLSNSTPSLYSIKY